MSSPSQNGIATRPQAFDGEGVDPQDFVALSAGSRAYINDLILSALMRSQAPNISPIGAYGSGQRPPIFAFGHGGAPRNGTGATPRTISCNPGAIFQAPVSGSINGATPKILSYYLNGGEISAQLDAGDPSNPRFDSVYVRLSEVDGPNVTRDFEDAVGVVTSQAFATTKQTKLEWLVVKGTAAALPVLPAVPDASYSLWGTWLVPAAFGASNFGLQHIFDYRVPLGFRRVAADARDFNFPGGWVYDSNHGELDGSAAGTNIAWVPCPARSGRIMSASISFRDTSGSGVGSYFLLISGRSLGTTPTAKEAPSRGSMVGPFATMAISEVSNWTLAGGLWTDPVSGHNLAPQFPVTVGGYMLLPLWANGWGSEAEDAAQASPGGYVTQDERKVIQYYQPLASGDTISQAIFEIAGGA